jgi:hypothetical protein
MIVWSRLCILLALVLFSSPEVIAADQTSSQIASPLTYSVHPDSSIVVSVPPSSTVIVNAKSESPFGWASIAIIAAGFLFGYRMLAGGLMSSASVKLTPQRWPWGEANGKSVEMVAIGVEIERNENWAIRLLDGQLVLTSCLNPGEHPQRDLPPNGYATSTLQLVPFVPTSESSSQTIRVVRRSGPLGTPFSDPRISLGPKDKLLLSGCFVVPTGTTCIVEVAISYSQWAWLRLADGVIHAATIVPPTDVLERNKTNT